MGRGGPVWECLSAEGSCPGAIILCSSPPILSLHPPLTPEDGSVPPACLQSAWQLNVSECLNSKLGWLVLLVNSGGHQIGVSLCLTLILPPLKLLVWLAVCHDCPAETLYLVTKEAASWLAGRVRRTPDPDLLTLCHNMLCDLGQVTSPLRDFLSSPLHQNHLKLFCFLLVAHPPPVSRM